MIMDYPKHKIIFNAIIGVILFLCFIYLVVFGRALGQQENHIGIVLVLSKVILNSEAVRIDDASYLAKDMSSFVNAMEQQGFTHVEQLGAAHIFRKDGKGYMSFSRMYSSYFMVFTYPKGN